MVYWDYSPLFNYMKEHGITQDSLIAASVVGSGVFKNMKHHKNVETASICRIMDCLQTNDIKQIIKVVEVKDDEDVNVPDCMRYDYNSKHIHSIKKR